MSFSNKALRLNFSDPFTTDHSSIILFMILLVLSFGGSTKAMTKPTSYLQPHLLRWTQNQAQFSFGNLIPQLVKFVPSPWPRESRLFILTPDSKSSPSPSPSQHDFAYVGSANTARLTRPTSICANSLARSTRRSYFPFFWSFRIGPLGVVLLSFFLLWLGRCRLPSSSSSTQGK